jgi:Dyp-type peroxidase family
MAIDLTRPASEVSIGDAAYAPMFRNLQANILKSHGRNASRHVFLRFTGDRAAVRNWIRTKIAPKVLSAEEQFRQAKLRHDGDKSFDGGVVTLFFLSAAGYEFLGFKTKGKLKSSAFRDGMKDQKKGLFKEVIEGVLEIDNKDPKPATWEKGFRADIHAMVLFADDLRNDNDNETRLLNEIELLKTQLGGIGEILLVDEGKALRRSRPDLPDGEGEPIEHFGYFDGISQPLFTREDLDRYYGEEKKGTRGAGNWDPSASLDLVLVPDPFADTAEAYGSYFVYRKLHQDVGAWNGKVVACAAAIGHDPNLTGAMAVGRFKDGTPVVDSKIANGDFNNDFTFDRDDPDGFACPRHGHVRKVNPRGTTPKPGLKTERARRIARRGIPYGRPVPGLCPPGVPTDANPGADRGLLFMCYQANIEKQFEFIQRVWVDNPNFPKQLLGSKDTGDDPVIGQRKNEPQRWPKTWGDKAAGRIGFNFEAAVTLKGGEYLFAPSLPFLASL